MLFVLLIASALCSETLLDKKGFSGSDASTRASSNASTRSSSFASARSTSSVDRIASAEEQLQFVPTTMKFEFPTQDQLHESFAQLEAEIDATLKEEQRWNSLTPEQKEAELYANDTKFIELFLEDLTQADKSQMSEEEQKDVDESMQTLEDFMNCPDYTARQEFVQDLVKVAEEKAQEEWEKYMEEHKSEIEEAQKKAQEESEKFFEALKKLQEEAIEAQEKWDDEHPEEVAEREAAEKKFEEEFNAAIEKINAEVEKLSKMSEEELQQYYFNQETEALEKDLEAIEEAMNEAPEELLEQLEKVEEHTLELYNANTPELRQEVERAFQKDQEAAFINSLPDDAKTFILALKEESKAFFEKMQANFEE